MVEDKVFRARSDLGGHEIRSRRREAPGRREFSREKHSAVELDSAQNLRESIHFRTPLDVRQSSPAPTQRNLLRPAVRASYRDGQAWPLPQSHCTIVDLKGMPRN